MNHTINTLADLFVIVLLLLSTAIHEMAHAFTATWLGDSTPERNGRLTLNPIPHLQPVMTAVILPVILFMSHMGMILLAQTPINPRNFRNPLRDHALVAIAGPIMNVVCAMIMIGVLWIPGVWISRGNISVTMSALATAAFYNFILAVFNLIPLPPLDGYWIIRAMLPPQARMKTDQFARNPFSFILVIIVGSVLIGFFDGPLAILLNYLLPN